VSDPVPDLGRSDPERRASALKERIYATFIALAVSIPLSQHSQSVAATAATLALTVVGTLLATFVADLIAHVAVHSALPGQAEVRRMASISAGASLVLVVPMLLFALAALNVVTCPGRST
jgi:ABC-type phosphate/phosphonate transport system permease subunit